MFSLLRLEDALSQYKTQNRVEEGGSWRGEKDS